MSNAMRLGCSAYGLLLLLYPQDLRSRYSGEMKLVFREQLQGELMRRGASGAARVALLAVWEVVSVAAPLQLRNPTVIAGGIVDCDFIDSCADVLPRCFAWVRKIAKLEDLNA